MSHPLGQVFLKDPNVLRKIRQHLPFPQDTWILEIGPGQGDLTQTLLEAGYRVLAIEIDPRLVAHLQKRLAEALQRGRLRLESGDFLRVPLIPLLERYGLQRPPVVSNIPYSITGPLIHKLVMHAEHLGPLYLTVQREVALRLTAAPGTPEYGALTVLVQACYVPRYLFTIRSGSFRPVPEVDSAFVGLLPRPQCLVPPPHREAFSRWTRQVFSWRRKTLRRIFRMLNAPLPPAWQSRGHLRPEVLSVADLYSLFQSFQSGSGARP